MECLTADLDEKVRERLMNRVKSIALGRTTVTNRVEVIAEDLEKELAKKLKDAIFWSFSIDESGDNTDIAQLILFVRYVDSEWNYHEDFLDIVPMHGRTTAEDIFNAFLDLPIFQIEESEGIFSNLSTGMSDSCPSMVGKKSGFMVLVKNHVQPFLEHRFLNFPCLVHQEALATKFDDKKSSESQIINQVSKMVNAIVSKSALSHRQFKTLVEQLQEESSSVRDLVLLCNSRWLSRSNLLFHFCELLPSVEAFFESNDKMHMYPELLDVQWKLHLYFLCDLFAGFKKLNLQMQGPRKDLLDMRNAMINHSKLINLQILKVKEYDYSSFPHLYKFICEGNPLSVIKHKAILSALETTELNLKERTESVDDILPVLQFFKSPFIPTNEVPAVAKV